MTTVSTRSTPTPEQIDQVQQVLLKLSEDAHVLALARLQQILEIAERDCEIQGQLHDHMASLSDLARARGYQVI